MDSVQPDERLLLRQLTQDSRFNLIQDILGHPKGLVSLHEFDYANPSLSLATIREHLQVLEKMEIVERHELPSEQRTRDLPSVFYGLSKKGEELLQKHELLIDELDEIEAAYANLEKPEKIQRFEAAPRPTV